MSLYIYTYIHNIIYIYSNLEEKEKGSLFCMYDDQILSLSLSLTLSLTLSYYINKEHGYGLHTVKKLTKPIGLLKLIGIRTFSQKIYGYTLPTTIGIQTICISRDIRHTM